MRFRLLIIFLFVFTGVNAQDIFHVFESYNDSVDISMEFYNDYDSLIRFLYPASDRYDNWSTDGVRYTKTDTALTYADSIMKYDTTYLILLPRKGQCYVHPRKDRINSRFGYRHGRIHYGIDVECDTGDSIFCAFDGTVRVNHYHSGYGNVVVVRHDNGLETVYAHLSCSKVDTAQRIKAGGLIGLGGSTGRSTGSHLHFEVRYLGIAINPEHVIDFTAFELKNDTLMLSSTKYNYLIEVKAQRAAIRNATFYYVRSGDTLGHIASRHGTSVGRICQLNGFSRTKILQIGQKIRVR